MSFLIADTFTASLARLTGDEQKVAKTTAFDLQLDPAAPGMQFHKLDRARDKRFWSVRVNADLRLIVHRGEGSLLLCFVGHHDVAYRWAESRRLERHPTTGAAQLVEVRETVREVERRRIHVPVELPRLVDVEAGRGDGGSREAVGVIQRSAERLFVTVPDGDLLRYGVPAEWISEVREATEHTLFAVAEHLPAEAAEALLQLATGGTPVVAVATPVSADPFAHPDAQRRFRVVANAEELARALDAPWESWTIFLHPAQRELVERSFGGPARVAGSAGTGKTIVALHRAVFLARANPEARVLLATFSEPLAEALRVRLRRLVGSELGRSREGRVARSGAVGGAADAGAIGERLEVCATHEIARRLYEASFGRVRLATDQEIAARLQTIASEVGGHRFSTAFIAGEWTDVVDAWQLDSWETYRSVPRLGRKTRLGEGHRAVLWSIFERLRAELAAGGSMTVPGMLRRLERRFTGVDATAVSGETPNTPNCRPRSPFDFIVVDEAQDLGVPELRFFAALAAADEGTREPPTTRPNALFFAGDLGQRIFQTPFSWRSLGVDVRGRSHTLRINYRTSHQIRRQADRLLPPELADVDGNSESRRGAISVFEGPDPTVRVVATVAAEATLVGDWLRARIAVGYVPHEIGIFVRSDAEIPRAEAAVRAAGLVPGRLGGTNGGSAQAGINKVAVGTMHLAKGLEYRAVVVAACDEDVVPLQSRIESVADRADLEDVYDTERHLLYVACTRARDQLLVVGVAPGSEFLGDLAQARAQRLA